MFIGLCRYRSRLHLLVLMLCVCTLTWSQPVAAAGPGIRITPGANRFSFIDEKGDPSKRMTVYTYLPKGLKPNTAPIAFVMHGHSKNAKGYRDRWSEHADTYGFMVIAPLFDAAQWGSGAYAYASISARDGQLRDASLWSFNVIEHLFDAIKKATGNPSDTYFIYGHSEGGQFVHRLVLFLPEARYTRAVVANPGWYTMPKFDVKFPYGLAGSPATAESLRHSLGRDVVLVLGDRDTSPNDADLNKTPQAMAQGIHRFERGQTFFKEAQHRATELQCAFGWRLQVVPGGTHSDRAMSRPAAAILMGR